MAVEFSFIDADVRLHLADAENDQFSIADEKIERSGVTHFRRHGHASGR
jgi:hypothetical protein